MGNRSSRKATPKKGKGAQEGTANDRARSSSPHFLSPRKSSPKATAARKKSFADGSTAVHSGTTEWDDLDDGDVANIRTRTRSNGMTLAPQSFNDSYMRPRGSYDDLLEDFQRPRGHSMHLERDAVGNSSLPFAEYVNKGLTEIPEDVLAGIFYRKLLFSRNDVTEIPPSLCGLSNVMEVDFTANRISDVPEDIGAMEKLEILLLAHNDIASFSHEWGLASLTHLDLSCNPLQAFPSGLQELPSLKVLALKHTSISKVEDGGAKGSLPPSLTSLDLSHNDVESLPMTLSMLTNLEYLGVAHNRLAFLPDVFHVTASLRVLDVSHNPLETLPPSLLSSPALSDLLAHHCRVQGWGSAGSPSRCDALSCLDLSWNLLEDVPDVVSGFSALQELSLTHNALIALPEEIGTLTRLKKLHVGCNQLSSLPSSLSQLVSLEDFSAFANQLESADELAGLPALTHVCLGYNKLRSLPDLSSSTCLRELFASGNSLTALPPWLFSHPSGSHFGHKLHTLCLAENQIRIRDADVKGGLSALPVLTRLDVSGNLVEALPAAILEFTESRGPQVELAWGGNPGHPDDDVELVSPCRRVAAASASLLGRRSRMEDAVSIYHDPAGPLDAPIVLALFDGHAGEEASVFCAQHLPPLVASRLGAAVESKGGIPLTLEEVTPIFEEIFAETQEALVESLKTGGAEDSAHVGTTAVVAALFPGLGAGYMANVGDSRAGWYQQDDSGMYTYTRLSVDHKPMDVAERARIRGIPGGHVVDGRVNASLGVSRSIGDSSLADYVTHQPYVAVFDLPVPAEDDGAVSASSTDMQLPAGFLVLACDGVWDVLDEAEAALVLAEEAVRAAECDPPQGRVSAAANAARTLRDHAYLHGSTDNVSVVVAAVDSVPAPVPASSSFTFSPGSSPRRGSILSSSPRWRKGRSTPPVTP